MTRQIVEHIILEIWLLLKRRDLKYTVNDIPLLCSPRAEYLILISLHDNVS